MTVVQTSHGPVRGTTTLTRRADVESYLGIPFAAPPVGALRFRPPQPPEAWTTEREVKRFAPAAPQNPDPVLAAGGFWQPPHDEAECLNLNVWTPSADDRARPVLVWIHGGAYVSGSNSTGYNNGAELAAALDVVVVSINYRLGVFGFLYLEHLLGAEFADSGNLAVLDQIAALHWVRDNIRAFGGDPSKVTIFGESAGAAAVGTLLGTPLAQGLFTRAIMQSGTAERAREVEESVAVTAEFLDAAGVTASDAETLLRMSTADLLAAQAVVAAAHAERTIGLPLPFMPTIDGRVLAQSPLDAIADGVGSDVDLLAGTNLNEASFFIVARADADETRTSDEKLRALIAEDFADPAAVRADYVAALSVELGREPSDDEVLESYLSDRLYRQPTTRLLDARQAASGRTFAYLFTWASPLMDGALGSCHALDVPFVFRQLDRLESASLVGPNPPVELSEWMSGAWVEFARRGAPNSPALPDWPQYLSEGRLTMELSPRPRVLSDPRETLRRFWRAEVTA
ncbi:carboxylesterase/lipase family protein [Homoserinibacter sp. GY 40078]|uniref:carboxylesterase/lipase family protein n=1 Tax=Homoserinibacter sp. GY 40078 TaxID=2603275 RepID=UPI0011CC5CCE|nr:carboxylesterase/lipase family protein [Homoserinibacter sp. GY 40078]TXK16397.1 carboxylesterase family protein [Homoserinibacter sp. GY 40078]